MPYIHKWKGTGVVREFSGLIDAIQILNSNLELHRQFSDIHYVINDFTRISEVTITAEQTKAFSSSDEMIAYTKGNLNIAIVISEEFLPLALAYQKQMVDSSFTCQIFKNMDEAEQWCRTST